MYIELTGFPLTNQTIQINKKYIKYGNIGYNKYKITIIQTNLIVY